jgi:hypothetical protein
MAKPKPPRSRVKPVATVLADVRKLIDWCLAHNSGRLVTRALDPRYCDDPGNNSTMWNILRYTKGLINQVDAAIYSSVFAVLDAVVIGDWRARKSGI